MKLIYYVMLSSLVLSGCRSTSDKPIIPRVDSVKTSESINSEVKNLSESSNAIKGDANTSILKSNDIIYLSEQIGSDSSISKGIKDASTKIKTLASELQTLQKNILATTDNINKIVLKLNQIDLDLVAINKQIRDTNKNNDELKKQNEALGIDIENYKTQINQYETGIKEQNNKIWMSVIGLCAIGTIVGIALAIWVNPKMGVGITTASIILSSLAYFMAKYAALIAIFGGVMFLVMIIWFIYSFVIHKKALIESAVTVEMVKHKDWEDVKVDVGNLQSNSTKDLINKIRHENQIQKAPKGK